jgi:hypothetical protein
MTEPSELRQQLELLLREQESALDRISSALSFAADGVGIHPLRDGDALEISRAAHDLSARASQVAQAHAGLLQVIGRLQTIGAVHASLAPAEDAGLETLPPDEEAAQ